MYSTFRDEDMFGSSKCKFDLPIGSNGDFHCPDKVNFFQPRVQLQSTCIPIATSNELNSSTNFVHVPHITIVVDSDYDTSQWYIVPQIKLQVLCLIEMTKHPLHYQNCKGIQKHSSFDVSW